MNNRELPRQCDIAVIGGGPAGATFARLAGPEHHVVLLDSRPHPQQSSRRDRGKCCGGLLAPDAQEELAAQGLALPLSLLVDPQIFAVRVIDLGAPCPERLYPRHYVNLDRARFDRWLLSLVAEGRVFSGMTARTITRTGEGFVVAGRSENGDFVLNARCVVGADGAASLVRRALFPDRPIRRYAAVQEWFEASGSSPLYGALFDPETTDCTGWLLAKDGCLGLGAAFPLDHPARRFALLKQKLEARGFVFGRRLRREGCLVCRPSQVSELVTGDGGAYLLGEAAGFVSPSSLEGISWALNSGALLARSLGERPETAGPRYRAASQGLRLRLAGKLMKCPFLYRPPLRRLILSTGVASLNARSPSPTFIKN